MDQLEEFEIGTLTEDAIAKINEMNIEYLQKLSKIQGTLLIEDARSGNRGQATYSSLATLKKLGHDFYKVIGFYKPNEAPKELNSILVNDAEEIIAPKKDLFVEEKKPRKTREVKTKKENDGSII